MRETITKGERLDTIIAMEPQDFLITKGQQQTMTSAELDEYIAKQKKRGFANIKEFQIEYHQRIAMSFAAFILTVYTCKKHVSWQTAFDSDATMLFVSFLLLFVLFLVQFNLLCDT